ncbi:hypothetical protein G7054_g6549 [Neopestalotiopsis clavispora]|nr:hypothetical protein G7054_g6549 [Neopestalotiopsis clavispora]
MGGWDVYCVICGSLASELYQGDDDVSDYENEDAYDRDITNDEDTLWLGNIVVMSENPRARAASKVFISGHALAQDYGYYEFHPGDDPDPNCPPSSTCWQVYERNGETPYAAPIHRKCLHLLEKVLQPKEADKDVLYEIFKCLGPAPILPIEYGAVDDCQEQYWITKRGTEEFVIDPVDISRLRQYWSQLPAADATGLDRRPGLPSRQTSSSDPFSKRIPPEVMLNIFHHLDWHSINRFRAASRQAAQLELSSRYWSSRLYQDMPWLYDIDLEKQAGRFHFPDNVDWTKVYRDLYLASDTASKNKIHGLVNRRRIWGICQQIANFYDARDSSLKNGSITEVMQDVQSTRPKQLIYPNPVNTTGMQMFIISRYAEMERGTPVISVYWTQEGKLARFTTAEEPGLEEPSPLRDEICIPEGDWITGFIAYSVDAERQTKEDAISYFTCGLEVLFAKRDNLKLRNTTNGNPRLLRVSPDHFLVGLAIHTSDEGLIARLALLEQPKTKMPFRSENRIIDHHDRLEGDIAEYVWRGALPSPKLKLTDLRSGYWSHSTNDETVPLEALVFGDCDSELSDITSISADVHFGRFEVHYGSRPSRAIGPRGHAMQYLEIDGRGGERVISVYWSVSHIPTGCRLVTNRGRQLILGQSSDNEGPFESFEFQDGVNRTLAGIVGHWSNRQLPQANLSVVGALFCHDVPVQFHDRPRRDPNNFFWAPEQLPSGTVEAGPIWGQREVFDKWQRRTKKYPSSQTVVSWLDCQQPVDEMKVTLCHSTRTRQLPLAAITLVQDSAATQPRCSKTIGAEKFSQPSDTTGTNGHHWCWCALGRRLETELEARPHHVHETWQVRGQKLKTMRLWLDEEEGVTGMQFVAMDDIKSPAWGHCQETPTTEIHFVAGDDATEGAPPPAVGVKFFLDNNERQVTRDDIIITAVQALVKEQK